MVIFKIISCKDPTNMHRFSTEDLVYRILHLGGSVTHSYENPIEAMFIYYQAQAPQGHSRLHRPGTTGLVLQIP